MELRPAYRTSSTFWGAVSHFWGPVPQIEELFHEKVELFHLVPVFLDIALPKLDGKNPEFDLIKIIIDVRKHVAFVFLFLKF